MIFDTKKEGGHLLTSRTSVKRSKEWFSSGVGRGGGGGGVVTKKTLWGMCLLDKVMILQGVKLKIQPTEVGYNSRPKKAQNGGGYVAFSPTYASVALI